MSLYSGKKNWFDEVLTAVDDLTSRKRTKEIREFLDIRTQRSTLIDTLQAAQQQLEAEDQKPTEERDENRHSKLKTEIQHLRFQSRQLTKKLSKRRPTLKLLKVKEEKSVIKSTMTNPATKLLNLIEEEYNAGSGLIKSDQFDNDEATKLKHLCSVTKTTRSATLIQRYQIEIRKIKLDLTIKGLNRSLPEVNLLIDRYRRESEVRALQDVRDEEWNNAVAEKTKREREWISDLVTSQTKGLEDMSKLKTHYP